MEHNKMIVIMEDGMQVIFFKENGSLMFTMRNEGCIYENKVQEGSVHAVVGEPLTFTYHYWRGGSEKAESEAPVKEINYE